VRPYGTSFRMRAKPQDAGSDPRIDPSLGPPCGFITVAVCLANDVPDIVAR